MSENFIAQCDIECSDCGRELPKGSQIIIINDGLINEKIICLDCESSLQECNNDDYE